jgi:ubiquinone/menaquinone biosynthesis C-methylase UbiE
MAATCPAGFDVDGLRAEIGAMYARLARSPAGHFHFHRGLEYAVQRLGYDRDELESLPSACVERFAGVGNPLRIGTVRDDETVLDHACGAGLDLLLAARRVGARGRAIGIDMTPAMREHAIAAAAQAGLSGVVEVYAGVFEDLPVPSASVDVVISNGVINLSPDKSQVFQEIARVLRPGGRLYLADVVVQRELKPAVRANAELWAACIGGALVEAELHDLIAAAGLTGGVVVERFDCFAGTSTEDKVAKDLRVHSVNVFAQKSTAR